ncbi:MAG: hypothetical protein ACETWQ_09365 [Phycisphaerae bacterium]
MMLGIIKDIEKAKVKSDIKLARAAESLEQIANDMDDWIGQQRDRFKCTTIAFRKKWISRWFSDFFIMELFKDKVHKKHFGDIVDTFCLYMPDIAESLKEMWHNFLDCANFMRQIQHVKNRVEGNHDLEYWCVNFFDTAVIPTVERLRHLAEQTREYLAAPKQAETVEKRPQGLLNKQVGKLLKSSPSDISASEIAKILNENYVGVYQPTTPCLVGKTENWKKHREKNKSRGKS